MANAFIFSHPQRTEIKKAADETETILETTPAGKSDGEGALRAFIKVHISFKLALNICCYVPCLIQLYMLQRQGQRLRRLSNLFGCRDPEYVSPEQSTSATPSDPTSSHGDPLEDEDLGIVTQEVWHEHIFNC